MGYAIPISDVESIIGDLMNKVTRDEVRDTDRGYLGITGVDVTSDASSNYGMPEGVYVNVVTEGGAADQAGLKKGDIITKLDGTRITGYAQLGDTLRYYASGETISITIQRLEDAQYVEKVLDITLSSGSQVGVESRE